MESINVSGMVGTQPQAEIDADSALWGNITSDSVDSSKSDNPPRIKFFKDSKFTQRLEELLKGTDSGSQEEFVSQQDFESRHYKAMNGDGSDLVDFLNRLQAHIQPQEGAEG